jgi:DNA replication protein DnaC
MFDKRGNSNLWGKFEGGLVSKWINTLNPFNIPDEVRGGCEDPMIRAQKCELLLLDDLGGREKLSEWKLETLTEIVNERYENLLPTIVTSNLHPSDADLMKLVEGRILDRLAENATYIEIAGESRRRSA